MLLYVVVEGRRDPMAQEWEYFEKDGAYFRRPKGTGTMSVHQMRGRNGWVPFKGPVFFGSCVTEAEATEGMNHGTEHPDTVE
jgi:hypothetical protein